MEAFVLDVSACMPWCCEDEATTASEQLLQRAALRHSLHVPSIWPWEMMNAVAVAVRRKRIKPEQAASFLGLLSDFDFHIAEAPDITDLPRLSALAARYQLTAYDAAYLDLAKRRALPLATLDDDLRKAALAEGIDILMSAAAFARRKFSHSIAKPPSKSPSWWKSASRMVAFQRSRTPRRRYSSSAGWLARFVASRGHAHSGSGSIPAALAAMR